MTFPVFVTGAPNNCHCRHIEYSSLLCSDKQLIRKIYRCLIAYDYDIENLSFARFWLIFDARGIR